MRWYTLYFNYILQSIKHQTNSFSAAFDEDRDHLFISRSKRNKSYLILELYRFIHCACFLYNFLVRNWSNWSGCSVLIIRKHQAIQFTIWCCLKFEFGSINYNVCHSIIHARYQSTHTLSIFGARNHHQALKQFHW